MVLFTLQSGKCMRYVNCLEATVRRGIENAVKTQWLRPIGRGKGFELCGSQNKMPIYNKNNICAELPGPSHAPDAPSGPPRLGRTLDAISKGIVSGHTRRGGYAEAIEGGHMTRASGAPIALRGRKWWSDEYEGP